MARIADIASKHDFLHEEQNQQEQRQLEHKFRPTSEIKNLLPPESSTSR